MLRNNKIYFKSLGRYTTKRLKHVWPFFNIVYKRVSLNSPLSPDIGQNWDRGISDFRISGETLIKENCDNSRTTDVIDMKLGPVTNLDKRNIATSKNFAGNVMLTNCDVIDIFPIYGRFGAILKPDSGHIALKTYIFIKSNLLSYENWK